ncbi:autotransporter outer membrane beta-barrel domain-containing protein [Trichloromonas sp.]|uniref:autotransporter outer membrane beta-barrel domain-containing protein n=1 Tax=Trichloromonas sp. TaxID=3069249 RepID=UPI003D8174D7
MLERIALVVLALLAISTGTGQAAEMMESSLEFRTGYRKDKIDWNIADVDNLPNILSELTWDDLEIYDVEVSGKLQIPFHNRYDADAVLKGSLGYGWIFDGENQDSDYDGNNRSQEYSRSNNDTDGDNVLDASIGGGFRFRMLDGRLALTPLAGLSYHEQNLNITDGVQTLATPSRTPPLGAFPGLDSSYETEWRTGWIGIDLDYQAGAATHLFGSAQYHWADFSAEAVWNLRNRGTDALAQSPSFRHAANGSGVVLAAGVVMNLTPRWTIDLVGDYQHWETDRGTDTIFLADGTIGKTYLNEVNWKSSSLSLGLKYRFF